VTKPTQTIKIGSKTNVGSALRALTIRMEEAGTSDLLFAGSAVVVAYRVLRRLFTSRETQVREPAITRISRQNYASFLVTVSYKKANAVAAHASLVRQFTGASVNVNSQQRVEIVNVREGQPMLSALVFAAEVQATVNGGNGSIERTIGRNDLTGTVTKAPEDQAAVDLWSELNGKQFDAALLQVDVTLSSVSNHVQPEAQPEQSAVPSQ